MTSDLNTLSGPALLAAVHAATTDPVDTSRLHALCAEVDGRIARGDMMIGILPVEAIEVRARGYAAAALAGRVECWTPLGASYLGSAPPRTQPAWPSQVPFADPGDQPVGAALRCFAEAAVRGDRQAALLFADVCRYASEPAKRFALTLLEPWRADDRDGQVTYAYGLVQYALGDAAGAAATHLEAAGLGDADAMFELSVLYVNGDGVPADPATAHTWLMRAAGLGHHRALYNVGSGHATGNGFPKDEALAAHYYELAAKAGNAQAAATLGVMYLLGQGVDADPASAASWLDLADESGFDVDGWLDRLGLDRPEH
jgi:hypothetical protein